MKHAQTYQMKIEENRDHCQITLNGEVSDYDSERIMEEILSMGKNISKYLFDISTLYGTTCVGNVYFYVQKLEKQRILKVALVVRNKEENILSTLKTFAVNRGIDLHCFNDLEIAKNWISMK
jgi:hypothetical protein